MYALVDNVLPRWAIKFSQFHLDIRMIFSLLSDPISGRRDICERRLVFGSESVAGGALQTSRFTEACYAVTSATVGHLPKMYRST